MRNKQLFQAGFTLIEISIVLLIVTILLGYTVAMFPIQQELKKYRKADAEINEIINQLIAFAQVNSRLPCPDTDGDGKEDTDNLYNNANLVFHNGVVTHIDYDINIPDRCLGYDGFLPRITLSMNGDVGSQGRLLDPWGQPYRYVVSESDESSNNIIDYVSPNEIRNEGFNNLTGDLNVCFSISTTGVCVDSPIDADTEPDVIASGVPAVVISTGKDYTSATPLQAENTDTDKVFIGRHYLILNDKEAGRFDDLVKWISPNTLYSKMIDAGQLP